METIIVDDEPKAIELLEFYLNEYFPQYKIVSRYNDSQSALEGILKTKPQVLFLDINMPNGNGIDLLTKIQSLNIITVFLTAHAEYAIEAIKQNAFDYLLKPINLEELNRVVLKIQDYQNKNRNFQEKKIKIQISTSVYLFEPNEIIFASSEGNYTTIYSTTQKPLVITKNMKKIEEEYLSCFPFFRCHQSFIVNINHISNFSNSEISLSDVYKASLSSKKYEELNRLIS